MQRRSASAVTSWRKPLTEPFSTHCEPARRLYFSALPPKQQYMSSSTSWAAGFPLGSTTR